MTQNIADKFKTSDLDTSDTLHKEKKDSIERLKKLFTQNLNTGDLGVRRNEDFWKRKGYYVEEVYFEDNHLTEVWEEKKVFIQWFLEKHPKYNILYDPQKRNDKSYKRKIEQADGSYYWVNVMRIARERDLLFGLNGAEIVTVDNWREKIKEAKSKEEIEDIEGLLAGDKDSLDDFVHWVRAYITLFVDNMQDIKGWMKKGNKNEHFFKVAVKRLERKIENKKGDSQCWGSKKSANQQHHEAGLHRAYLVARKLLEPELKKSLEEANMLANKKGISYDWVPKSI